MLTSFSRVVLFGFTMPGPLELCIIGGIVLLLFGSRIPSVMRNLGSGIKEFKEGMQGIEKEIDEAGSKEASP